MPARRRGAARLTNTRPPTCSGSPSLSNLPLGTLTLIDDLSSLTDFAYSLSSETARKAGGGQLSVKDSIIAGMIAGPLHFSLPGPLFDERFMLTSMRFTGSATTVITNPLWVVRESFLLEEKLHVILTPMCRCSKQRPTSRRTPTSTPTRLRPRFQGPSRTSTRRAASRLSSAGSRRPSSLSSTPFFRCVKALDMLSSRPLTWMESFALQYTAFEQLKNVSCRRPVFLGD